MLVKTVSVTNPKNVVLQIPGYIASVWGLTTDSALAMYYNDETEEVTIKPYVQRRRPAAECMHEMAGAPGA